MQEGHHKVKLFSWNEDGIMSVEEFIFEEIHEITEYIENTVYDVYKIFNHKDEMIQSGKAPSASAEMYYYAN